MPVFGIHSLIFDVSKRKNAAAICVVSKKNVAAICAVSKKKPAAIKSLQKIVNTNLLTSLDFLAHVSERREQMMNQSTDKPTVRKPELVSRTSPRFESDSAVQKTGTCFKDKPTVRERFGRAEDRNLFHKKRQNSV
jgi:hypothetical protein